MSFEPGAKPANGFIPLCVPEIRGREWEFVKDCLDTGWVSSVGSYVDRFEREIAAFVGAKHAVAVVNGTSALHISLLLAGVKPDDEVLVSTLTFIAPVNAIRYVNAWPVLVDAEPDNAQMDSARVKQFLGACHFENGRLLNPITGRRIAAILPVDVLGHPCDMDAINEVANRHGLPVIEDATESLGAKYKNRAVGMLGHIGCFSFNGNKVMTTGGGGMIVTDNEAWAKKARYLTTQAKDDPVEYVHNEIGFNFRLTNIQAALGCAQLEQLPSFIARKRAAQSAYENAFAAIPGLEMIRAAPWAESIFWMPTLKLDPKIFPMDRRALLAALQARQIQTRPLWQPAHLNKPFRECQRLGGAVAENFHAVSLNLPCSGGITDSEIERVISAIRDIARG